MYASIFNHGLTLKVENKQRFTITLIFNALDNHQLAIAEKNLDNHPLKSLGLAKNKEPLKQI